MHLHNRVYLTATLDQAPQSGNCCAGCAWNSYCNGRGGITYYCPSVSGTRCNLKGPSQPCF
ncbi:hypothetical protein PTRG_02687 [Pyrenophora tritici-repentis Pt-1C-BFP]|uniref:Uncharacterized protein n=1 Tax=Pyrenophora tritici-repentis (strain Pt-1C-BFP) TaxID=426418 RepID=B2VZ47_PYRTR|nr:uncharacterized protein PTRG_02687 [Pyrenophora tritici-repentis Pt-1C-BFP]EDU45210.1 hypothetical protein PTRG_02687 [Pyrenophora tritici-repentis Pt-1C-BFP]